MQLTADIIERLSAAVRRERLLDTAQALCAIYSPTRSARAVLDALAETLTREGFAVERPAAGWPEAPAVAVRLDSGRPGRTLQFNGHLDTVHLPFVPPAVEGDRLTGSGSSDMKAGLAAAVEALRALRETALLPGGSVLLTAHDLHEAPWGDGSQVDGLIDAGYVGDAVLIPEYLRDVLGIAGRGQAVLKIRVRRPGPPVHEVYRPRDEPSVIEAAARVVERFAEWNAQLAKHVDPHAGSESVFLGQIHAGEIYNQFPQECRLEGTRRWLATNDRGAVEADYRARLAALAREAGATVEGEFIVVRDAFQLDVSDPAVAAFEQALAATCGQKLPRGGKPFVDDANTFWSRAGVAAITHGPQGGGAHTLAEWVSIDDLVRVARVYAATAVAYCGA